tara:strand:- start:231 stop:479 length:249 start_codon:yes stop_codon:yes gene_type:complete
MNSMVDQELGFIRINPGDSVKKWGCVQEVTVEGILVLITYVDKGQWSSDEGYIVNTVRFIAWQHADFYKCTAFEAHTGKRPD